MFSNPREDSTSETPERPCAEGVRLSTPYCDVAPCELRAMGWRMLTRLPSVSVNETYRPMPGISMGSPRTLPPAPVIFFTALPISLAAEVSYDERGLFRRWRERA
jgi:hypothetical protein